MVTRKELLQRAKDRGCRNISKLRKEELERLLERNIFEDPFPNINAPILIPTTASTNQKKEATKKKQWNQLTLA